MQNQNEVLAALKSKKKSSAITPIPLHIETNTLLLDLHQAAALAGLTIWQIRGLIAKGEIKPVWVGDKLYIRRTTLLRWAERAEGDAA